MQIAAILLGIAALGGVTMVAIRASKKINPPTGLAVVHGLVAAAGLVTLLYHVFTATAPVPQLVNWAIGLFVAAALGGLGLFTLFHLRNRLLPVWMMLGHGAVGATGLVLLLLAIYRP
jgi:hypothetical protein